MLFAGLVPNLLCVNAPITPAVGTPPRQAPPRTSPAGQAPARTCFLAVAVVSEAGVCHTEGSGRGRPPVRVTAGPLGRLNDLSVLCERSLPPAPQPLGSGGGHGHSRLRAPAPHSAEQLGSWRPEQRKPGGRDRDPPQAARSRDTGQGPSPTCPRARCRPASPAAGPDCARSHNPAAGSAGSDSQVAVGGSQAPVSVSSPTAAGCTATRGHAETELCVLTQGVPSRPAPLPRLTRLEFGSAPSRCWPAANRSTLPDPSLPTCKMGG